MDYIKVLKKYFLERLETIWNELDLECHQGFTCKYLDDLISHFQDIQDKTTYDDVDFKLSEIKGIISILNPDFKKDLKVFNRLLKELDLWKTNIDKLKRIYSNS